MEPPKVSGHCYNEGEICSCAAQTEGQFVTGSDNCFGSNSPIVAQTAESSVSCDLSAQQNRQSNDGICK